MCQTTTGNADRFLRPRFQSLASALPVWEWLQAAAPARDIMNFECKSDAGRCVWPQTIFSTTAYMHSISKPSPSSHWLR